MIIKTKGKDDPLAVVGAPALALVVYGIFYFLATFIAKSAPGSHWYSFPIMTAEQIVFSLCGMGLARLCCDKAFKEYPRTGPFILSICIGIFLIAGHIMSNESVGILQLKISFPVFTVLAAYWWFCYGAPLLRPFVLFGCIALTLVAVILFGMEGDNPILIQLAWLLFTITAAFLQFRHERQKR